MTKWKINNIQFLILGIPWTVQNIKHAVGGYRISHWRKNTGIWILLANNWIRENVSWSSRSSNTQSELSIFTSTKSTMNRLWVYDQMEETLTFIQQMKLSIFFIWYQKKKRPLSYQAPALLHFWDLLML